jgi:hypothetical protein
VVAGCPSDFRSIISSCDELEYTHMRNFWIHGVTILLHLFITTSLFNSSMYVEVDRAPFFRSDRARVHAPWSVLSSRLHVLRDHCSLGFQEISSPCHRQSRCCFMHESIHDRHFYVRTSGGSRCCTTSANPAIVVLVFRINIIVYAVRLHYEPICSVGQPDRSALHEARICPSQDKSRFSTAIRQSGRCQFSAETHGRMDPRQLLVLAYTAASERRACYYLRASSNEPGRIQGEATICAACTDTS